MFLRKVEGLRAQWYLFFLLAATDQRYLCTKALFFVSSFLYGSLGCANDDASTLTLTNSLTLGCTKCNFAQLLFCCSMPGPISPQSQCAIVASERCPLTLAVIYNIYIYIGRGSRHIHKVFQHDSRITLEQCDQRLDLRIYELETKGQTGHGNASSLSIA